MMKKSLRIMATVGLALAATLVPLSQASAATGADRPAVRALPICKGFSTVKRNFLGTTIHTHVPTTGSENHAANCQLSYGDRGAGVFVLQAALSRCFTPIAVDGIYGNETQNSVRFIQGLADITPDGIYGPQTMKIMEWPFFDPDNKFIGCARL